MDGPTEASLSQRVLCSMLAVAGAHPFMAATQDGGMIRFQGGSGIRVGLLVNCKQYPVMCTRTVYNACNMVQCYLLDCPGLVLVLVCAAPTQRTLVSLCL